MEISDRRVSTRLVQAGWFDQGIYICCRDLAARERTITRILRRELANRLSRLPKQLEAKPADVSSVFRSLGEVPASPLAFPPHFKPANSSPFNLTVNQTSVRMDTLEASIQDGINVELPLSPTTSHGTSHVNVFESITSWSDFTAARRAHVCHISTGEFLRALGRRPDFPAGHVLLTYIHRLRCTATVCSQRQSCVNTSGLPAGCLSTNGFPLPVRLSRVC
jgi:hypothetical protein